MNILTVNLALSTLVFWIAAKLYVLPKLQDYEARAVLLPILSLLTQSGHWLCNFAVPHNPAFYVPMMRSDPRPWVST